MIFFFISKKANYRYENENIKVIRWNYKIWCYLRLYFFITIKNINKALNGDKVICTIIGKREAKVLDIIKRKKQKYVGVVIEENNKKLIEYNSNKDNFIFETREKK